tara:strand:+ start:1913 stop:2185 length:273 start_codon:yes stop_codon:yes gene_type:complete
MEFEGLSTRRIVKLLNLKSMEPVNTSEFGKSAIVLAPTSYAIILEAIERLKVFEAIEADKQVEKLICPDCEVGLNDDYQCLACQKDWDVA